MLFRPRYPLLDPALCVICWSPGFWRSHIRPAPLCHFGAAPVGAPRSSPAPLCHWAPVASLFALQDPPLPFCVIWRRSPLLALLDLSLPASFGRWSPLLALRSAPAPLCHFGAGPFMGAPQSAPAPFVIWAPVPPNLDTWYYCFGMLVTINCY